MQLSMILSNSNRQFSIVTNTKILVQPASNSFENLEFVLQYRVFCVKLARECYIFLFDQKVKVFARYVIL